MEDETVIKDKYTEAIEYLTAHPKGIKDAWLSPATKRGGCLFQFLTKSGFAEDLNCGCPTIVRCGDGVAATEELTETVRRNRGIPKSIDNVRPKHLPAFARIQRVADGLLKRS